jgi:hypothetical protein
MMTLTMTLSGCLGGCDSSTGCAVREYLAAI